MFSYCGLIFAPSSGVSHCLRLAFCPHVGAWATFRGTYHRAWASFHVTGAIVPTLQQYILGHLLGRLFESRDIVGDVVLSFCVIKQHVNVCEDTWLLLVAVMLLVCLVLVVASMICVGPVGGWRWHWLMLCCWSCCCCCFRYNICLGWCWLFLPLLVLGTASVMLKWGVDGKDG